METITMTQASKEFNAGRNTIKRWILLNDIPYESAGKGKMWHIDAAALRTYRKDLEEKIERSVPLSDLAKDFGYNHLNSLNQHSKQLRGYILNDKMYISKRMFNRYKGTVSTTTAAKHFGVKNCCIVDWIERYNIPAPRLGVTFRVRISDFEKARSKETEEFEKKYEGWYGISQLIHATKGKLTRKMLTNRVKMGKYPKVLGHDGRFLFNKEHTIELIKEAFSTVDLIPTTALASTMGYKDTKSILKHVDKSIPAIHINGRWYVTKETYQRFHHMLPLSNVAKQVKTTKASLRKWIVEHDIPHELVGDTVRLRVSDVRKLERFEWINGTVTIPEIAKLCNISRSKADTIVRTMDVPRRKVDGVWRFTMGQYAEAAIEYEHKMDALNEEKVEKLLAMRHKRNRRVAQLVE